MNGFNPIAAHPFMADGVMAGVRERRRPVRQACSHPTALDYLSFLASWAGKSLRRRAARRTSEMAKRTLDLAVSVLALALLLPLFLLVGIAIKLWDGGPVFFWQERVGLHGRVFAFPKFRSMVLDAEARKSHLLHQNQHGNGVTFKMKRDPRITPVGRILRRFSIDEMPQLWCVLKGEMSLVGPRPALTSEVERYSLRERARLQALPGLTCTWQVNGRSEIPFEKQVEMDERYVRERTFWFDLCLLFQTVPAVLGGKGAY